MYGSRLRLESEAGILESFNLVSQTPYQHWPLRRLVYFLCPTIVVIRFATFPGTLASI
jgi:hypothetical protein